MRKTLTVAVLLGAVSLTAWGQDEAPTARYGVPPNVELYTQETPKAALASAVRAVEKGRTDYLAAHLIDPQFIDTKVAERARSLERQVTADLLSLRASQLENPTGSREGRVPVEPQEFQAAVQQEAARRAFRLLAREIQGTLDENPDHLKDLRRFLALGQFTDAGDTATATLRDVPDRVVSFRKVGDRWFLQDSKKPASTPAPAPEKK